jgi:hypothetical protein
MPVDERFGRRRCLLRDYFSAAIGRLTVATCGLFEGNGVIGSKATLARSGSKLRSAMTILFARDQAFAATLSAHSICDHQKRSPERRISMA